MQECQYTLNQGQVQADLDGLPIAEARVTPLQLLKILSHPKFLDYIKPGTGRRFSEDWQMNDLAHAHFVAEVTDVKSSLDKLQQQE